jgi:hypothetical protein
MSLQQLKTNNVAKDVTDRLDQMRHLDTFPTNIQDRLNTKAKLIRALNEGDIEACGYLKPVSQFVLFVPQGNREIYLRNSNSYKTELENAINNSSSLTSDQKSIILELQPWTKVGKVKSSTLHAYSDIPYPDHTSKGEEFSIVTFNDFRKQDVLPDRSTALYHPHEERIVFSKAMDSDKFITFQGTIMPEKIDIAQVSDWPDYSISCPVEGERLLILCTLKEVMPLASPLVAHFEELIAKEKRKVISRLPKKVGSFKVEPRF